MQSRNFLQSPLLEILETYFRRIWKKRTKNVMNQQMGVENVFNQEIEAQNVMRRKIGAKNVISQKMGDKNVIRWDKEPKIL